MSGRRPPKGRNTYGAPQAQPRGCSRSRRAYPGAPPAPAFREGPHKQRRCATRRGDSIGSGPQGRGHAPAIVTEGQDPSGAWGRSPRARSRRSARRLSARFDVPREQCADRAGNAGRCPGESADGRWQPCLLPCAGGRAQAPNRGSEAGSCLRTAHRRRMTSRIVPAPRASRGVGIGLKPWPASHLEKCCFPRPLRVRGIHP